MLRVFLAFGLLLPLCVRSATPDAFTASPEWPAPFVARIKPVAAAGDVLRRLTVEERVGESRADELVRVPLFLHEDEPNDPARWALYAADDTARRTPLRFQLDDLRRDETGRLTRCHLYFTASLAAWERRQFLLVRSNAPQPSPPPAALTCTREGDRVRLAGEDLALTLLAEGPRAGAIVGISPRGAAVRLPDDWIAPELTLVRQAADCSVLRRTRLSYANPEQLEIRDIRWGGGPLFAKCVVRVGPRGQPDSAEFTYRVPRRGSYFIQTERLAPEGAPTAEVVGAADHRLLAGRLQLIADTPQQVVAIPAGLRELTRATSGHTLTALVAPAAGRALLPVPFVQTGGGRIELDGDDELVVAGADTFRRGRDGNSGTLRAFWGEVRYVFAATAEPEALWHEARRHFQPLVAIVDEPALGPADCLAAFPAIAQRFGEIQYWSRNWVQEAALVRLRGDNAKFEALLDRKPAAAETDPSFHLPKWARTDPPAPRDPKDQGRVDPYMLAYGSSTIPLFALHTRNPNLPPTARAIGTAARRAFGRVNTAGFPYVDCFATAFNMQLGPLGLALHGGNTAGDPALAAWARDALHAPAVTAIYGHGQRAYPGELRRPEPSDLLYEAICEFHLRSLELATGEDLWIHPAALARYYDCVDVTADLQHRAVAEAAGPAWARANFFRGQAHDHRWTAWACAPFSGLFARREDRGEIGSTEAAYWLTAQGQRKQNWADLLWYAHTALLLENLDRLPAPTPAPARPQKLEIRRTGGANALRWAPVAGAAAYRIYRAAQPGGPWTWLNSPYNAKPAATLAAPAFTDRDGREGDVYLVTAVDAAGRESRWYDDEPRR